MIRSVPFLYSTAKVWEESELESKVDEDPEGRTANWNERSSHNDLLPVLVFESLTKDVHVKRSVEAETETLTEERRRLAVGSDRAVGQGELRRERVMSA